MKKLFCLFICVAMFVSFGFSEGNGGLTGFYGIKFGTPKEDAMEIIQEKGWKEDKITSKFGLFERSIGNPVYIQGGTYAGKEFKKGGNDAVILFFKDNEFIGADVIVFWSERIKQKVDSKKEAWLDSVMKGTIDKYSLTLIKSNGIDLYVGTITYNGIYKISDSIDNGFEVMQKRILRFVDYQRWAGADFNENDRILKEIQNKAYNSDDL